MTEHQASQVLLSCKIIKFQVIARACALPKGCIEALVPSCCCLALAACRCLAVHLGLHCAGSQCHVRALISNQLGIDRASAQPSPPASMLLSAPAFAIAPDTLATSPWWLSRWPADGLRTLPWGLRATCTSMHISQRVHTCAHRRVKGPCRMGFCQPCVRHITHFHWLNLGHFLWQALRRARGTQACFCACLRAKRLQ